MCHYWNMFNVGSYMSLCIVCCNFRFSTKRTEHYQENGHTTNRDNMCNNLVQLLPSGSWQSSAAGRQDLNELMVICAYQCRL